MYVKFEEKSGAKCVFLIVGGSMELATSLRRIMLAKVPTYAIEYVTFTKNTTILSDQFIAHRLGLLPITVTGDLTDYESTAEQYDTFAEEEPTQEKKVMTFTFSKTSGQEPEEWYGEDMVFVSNNDGVFAKVSIDGIPIVKACRGQQLEFTAELAKHSGCEHSKWCPVSICFPVQVPEGIRFTVESVGTMPATDIVLEAVKIFREELLSCKENMQTETFENA